MAEPEDEEVAASIADARPGDPLAFHTEQRRLGDLTLCPCNACHQIGQLTVKVVAHVGEVVEQKVHTRTTVAGPDVILVHRMLKNTVPVAEYVLLTEPVLERCSEASCRRRPIAEDLEGLGATRSTIVDIHAIARARRLRRRTSPAASRSREGRS